MEPEANGPEPLRTFLQNHPAHPDLAGWMRSATRELGAAKVIERQTRDGLVLTASTDGAVFMIGIGMNSFGFLLDERMESRARISGGIALPEAGPGWVAFQVFRDDWPRPDLEFWARKAYSIARERLAG